MNDILNNRTLLKFLLLILIFIVTSYSAPEENNEYIIDQPGTITFTSGVKIKGKVEKPQVVIFMSKEKTASKSMDFNHSFKDDILEPIDFNPIIDDLSNIEKK